MSQQQQRSVFFVASAAALVLVILAAMYLAGTAPLVAATHPKRALLCFALAVGALAVAYVNRAGLQGGR